MGEVLIHPTQGDSAEATLKKAESMVEKIRSDKKTPYCVVLVGADRNPPQAVMSAAYDCDLSASAMLLNTIMHCRIEDTFSSD